MAEVQRVVEPVCSADDACVGYHVNVIESDNQYLEADLLPSLPSSSFGFLDLGRVAVPESYV
eukprot:890183-Pyramimonas_sp.AAC.1